MEKKPILSAKDVEITFSLRGNKLNAIRKCSLDLYDGETLAIVGESGSGKSVTAYSIMQILAETGEITEGSVKYKGEDITKWSERELHNFRGSKCSIIFQDPMTSLNPVFTVGNQLCEAILLHTDKNKKEAKERAIEMLTLVGVNEPESRMKQYPHELSGGMRQRVLIAMAFACEPEVIIADEPTTALDVTIQAQILELLSKMQKEKQTALLLITHDLSVVRSMADRIAVMYAGHIVEYGTTDEIFYQPGHEYTKGLINSIPKLNTAEHERLVPIEGTPVDLLNPPAGCPFAPRCKNCMKICLSKMPPRTELSDTHYTYCWLQQKAEFEKGEKAE